MWGISGDIGEQYGNDLRQQQIDAQKAIVEQLRQQLLQQQMADLEERRTTEREDRNAKRKNEEAAATAAAEQGASQKRTLGNLAGLVDMSGEGLDPETALRESVSTSLRGGMEPPKAITELFKREPPKEPKRHLITTIGKRGEQIQRLMSEDDPSLAEGVPSYREPRQAPQQSPQWVQDAQGNVHHRVPRPGDRPHDKTPPKDNQPSPYSAERNTRTVQSVNELIGKVNRWTTGAGSLLSGIPETDARNFAAELDTLKANIAFNELTEMREASKTGGALGQVSNVELGLLTSALGALDAGQSPENLKAQLGKIRDSIDRWQKARGGGGAPRSLEPMRPMKSHGDGGETGGAVQFRFNPATGKLEPVQ